MFYPPTPTHAVQSPLTVCLLPMQWWHPEALWFANISNMILWFTYVKGAWRALTGKFGAGITFKTTIKGAGRLLDSVLGDLWMPGACFVLSLVSLIYGIRELVSAFGSC